MPDLFLFFRRITDDDETCPGTGFCCFLLAPNRVTIDIDIPFRRSFNMVWGIGPDLHDFLYWINPPSDWGETRFIQVLLVDSILLDDLCCRSCRSSNFFLILIGIVSGRNERDIPGDAPPDARSLLRSGIFISPHTRHSPVSIDLHGNICQRVLCFDNIFFIHRGLPPYARATVPLLDVRDADHRCMLSGMCVFIPEKRTSW